jgi:hypothetical protein
VETKNAAKVCGRDHSYNGWTNYETWLVALWIDNEQGTHEQRREMARDIKSNNDSEDAHIDHFGDAIREWVEEAMMPDHGATLAADLLNGALSDVNWREIAENWLDEVEES